MNVRMACLNHARNFHSDIHNLSFILRIIMNPLSKHLEYYTYMLICYGP